MAAFPCKDCGRRFGSAQSFIDHFRRFGKSQFIIGCIKAKRYILAV